MTLAAPAQPGLALDVRPITLDDFSAVRHLHARSLCEQTADVLDDAEVAAFVRLVYSPDYSDLLVLEDIYGAWFDGELVGTASWHASPDDGLTARIGSVFVRHTRFGIGRRLVSEVEARAFHAGFARFSSWTTANAVPFFERLGYKVASRGVKALSPECALPVAFLSKRARVT